MNRENIPWQKTGFLPVRKRGARWSCEFVRDHKVFKQIREEAGLAHCVTDPEDAYDRLLTAAGRHGIGLETTEEQDTV
jgi:hypothetical protein